MNTRRDRERERLLTQFLQPLTALSKLQNTLRSPAHTLSNTIALSSADLQFKTIKPSPPMTSSCNRYALETQVLNPPRRAFAGLI